MAYECSSARQDPGDEVGVHLKVDPVGNRIACGDRWVVGRHRWEAAVLASLLSACQGGEPGRRGSDDLDDRLLELGQEQPLQRRQWARVLDGLRDCFAQLGPGPLAGFDLRFGHGPRQRTVGPWWWKPQPGDLWQPLEEGRSPAVAPAGLPLLPTLADGADPAAAARFCLQLMVAQALAGDGLHSDACQTLLDEAAWAGGSTELQALRHLQVAESATAVRQFGLASQALTQVERLTQSHLAANRLLAAGVRAARLRLAHDSQPAQQLDQLLASASRLAQAAADAPATVQDADAWLVMSQCELRWLGRQLSPGDAQAHDGATRALAWAQGALAVALAHRDPQRAQRACTQLAALHARLALWLGPAQWALALDWHGASDAFQHRFDLPLNSAWEFIWLGDLWLSQSPSQQAALPPGRCTWHNLTPDQIEFHRQALETALRLDDAHQVARAALNLQAFAERMKLADEAGHALKVLAQTMKAHPGLRVRMIDDGCQFPAPLRRRRPREAPVP